MTRRLLVAAALVLAAPGAQRPSGPAPKPPRPDGAPDSVAVPRVDVLFRPRAALVTVDVTFGRGSWRSGDVPLFVAYGAPGVPSAFEARISSLEPGRFHAEDGAGSPLPTAAATSGSHDAILALGPTTFAGETVRIDGATLASAFDRSPLVDVQLRAVHRLPSEGERSVVVRIAPPHGPPPPLGVVTVRADAARIARASATLCTADPQAPDRPLAIPGFAATPPFPPPSRARRTEGESLCVSAALAP